MNNNAELIAQLEGISLGGWPAIEEEEYDRWILRASAGYTGRANSIVPLDHGVVDIEEKIQYCESWYNRRGLSATYKLTDATDYISSFLDLRKYEKRPLVNVQILDITQFNFISRIEPVILPIEDWIEAYRIIANQSELTLAIHASLLNMIKYEAEFAVIYAKNEPVCCGVFVNQGEYTGVFDVYTAPSAREHGYARELVVNLINSSMNRGARYAYLQVIADNLPAVSLYEKLGFNTQYQYWYRQQQKAD